MRRAWFLSAAALAACTRTSGELDVVFTFRETPPADKMMLVSTWIEDENAQRLGAVGPVLFDRALELDFGSLPNDRPLTFAAAIADGRWKNSRVLYHGRSDPFAIEPGLRQTVEVPLEPGPWSDAPPGAPSAAGPASPNAELIVEHRFPYGAAETNGEERYQLEGAAGAVGARLRVVAFDHRELASAKELGLARAGEHGEFTLNLEPTIARTRSELYVAAIDDDDRASDAASDEVGLQAIRVEQIALTVTPRAGRNTPKLARAALLQDALDQPNLVEVGGEELDRVRAREHHPLAIAPEPVWLPTDRQRDTRRGVTYGASAYDAKRGLLVGFGGFAAQDTLVGDTWEWDGETWEKRSTHSSAPFSRAGAMMAYDARRGETVLFGGIGHLVFGDTWEWDGVEWYQVSDQGPEPRISGTMTYDSDRGRVLLFGGTPDDARYYSELWSWDGENWDRIDAPGGPQGRASAKMVYDPIEHRVLLYGGERGTQVFADLWEWREDSGWNRLDADGAPGPRRGHDLAFDPRREALVIFGGDDQALYADARVWEWSRGIWSSSRAAGPSPRSASTLTYDAVAGGVVLFGGLYDVDLYDETWLWNGEVWRDLSSGPKLGTPAARFSAAAAASDDHLLLYGGTGEQRPLDDLWESDRGRWRQRPPEPNAPLPTPRHGASMLFDPFHGKTILFGGVLNDENLQSEFDPSLWIFDGDRWEKNSPPGPHGRFAHAAAWDSQHQRMFLFGGYGGSFYYDLWVWDANGWRALPSDTGPSGRDYATAAYDPERDQLVIFGGRIYGPDGELVFSNGTWTWSTTSGWVNASGPMPDPRYGHAMVYDPLRRNIVLFGGGDDSDSMGDTWIWDGTRWGRRTPPQQPPPRQHHAMVFDDARGTVVLFGGYDWSRDLDLDDMWEWNGDTWSPIPLAEPRPSARIQPAMSYDPVADRIYLFSGDRQRIDVRDLWSFEGTTWTNLTPETIAPPALSEHALAYHAPSSSAVLFGGLLGNVLFGETWTFDGELWRPFPGASPPARRGHSMGADPLGQVMMFGGQTEDAIEGDTWIYNGQSWLRPPNLDRSPEPRTRHAAALEPSGERTILYGGSGPRGKYSDTWIWNGEQWASHEGPTPPARDGHAMAADPARDRIVLFGGLSNERLLSDTWEWTREQGWIERHPPPPVPEPRHFHTLATDPERGRVVLIGGSARGADDYPLDEIWALHAPPDQHAGLLVTFAPEQLGVTPERIEALSAVVDAENSELYGWDVYQGAWRVDFAEISNTSFLRLIDPVGALHLLVRGAEQQPLEVDYLELTIRYRDVLR